eukprot:TRINITY_DN20817_c0_g1_i1.p1 TRINITY_DN20817_c0_g1~~TRINITY_DN20817_c0_g1_i1.p1  ORF type:complete len:357 (+),score=97.80 TRINITY_DN20817_c0_g1_i1:70-1140(+)
MMYGAGAAPPAKRFKGAGKMMQQPQTIPFQGASQPPPSARGDPSGNSAEVRFESSRSARNALNTMQGSLLQGSPLKLEMDPNSKDQTRLLVSGIPTDIEWQEVKDHFAQVGNLAFVQIHGHERRGPKGVGEVRYESAEGAQMAMQALDGSVMMGNQISVQLDKSSKDGSKLIVTRLPAGIGWQDLKDHFKQVGGDLAYVGINKDGGPRWGEVRYEDPSHAQIALQALQGSSLGGYNIQIEFAPGSQDGTKLHVTKIGPGVEWQELKDHFGQIGTVAFSQVHKEQSFKQQLQQMGLPPQFMQMAKGGGGFGGFDNMMAMAPMMMAMGAMMGQGCGMNMGKGYGKWGGNGGWKGKGKW